MSCHLLADALQRSKRYQAVAAVTPADVLQALDYTPFHLALINATVSDDPLGGFHLVRDVRDMHPEVSVIVLLDALERDLVVEAFRSGANGVFCRADSFQSLCKSIQCVHAGQVWASSSELLYVLDALVDPAPVETRSLSGLRPLSKREEEIARLVAEGLSNRQISQRLTLSEHTIKNYLFRVFEKLGVSTRVELALHALKQRQVRRSGTLAIAALPEKFSARP